MTKPTVSTIEKAYIRGLKEGMRRGAAKRDEQGARITELIIRLKTAKGELKRRALVVPDVPARGRGGSNGPRTATTTFVTTAGSPDRMPFGWDKRDKAE